MRFASLGSGSRGNATLVQHAETTLLIDCGFSRKQLELRLQRLGVRLTDLDAVLVTHEHGDHVGGVLAVARAAGVPVWTTNGTARAARLDQLPSSQLRLFSAQKPFQIKALEIQPFAVPHDAREPSQFVFSDGAQRLGLLTDVGEITPHIVAMLQGCDALLLEANYDEVMLENGPYPAMLKRRVGGRLGHLSNHQAAGLLQQMDCGRLQHLVAMHLSEKNNQPQLAQGALAAVLNCPPHELDYADQTLGFDWRVLH